jgi:hypothetical protein
MKILQDNKGIIGALLGFILLAIYFLFTWSKVGVDPPKGVIFPRFEAPKNLSPAAVRFIYKMGFDRKTFTAAILDLAVKGYLEN